MNAVLPVGVLAEAKGGEPASPPRPPAPEPAPAARPGLLPRALRLLDALARHHGPSAEHSLRVATILLAMWRLMPEPGLDAEEVAAAGLLHDIGKLSLPLAILDGRRRLDAAEREEVAAHPERGASLLRALGFPPGVEAAALTHHERWDGAGYPHGLSGEAIPLLGRLTAVADGFVAMIEPGRAYRAPRSAGAALEEVLGCAGTQFEPAAARLLEAALGRAEPPAPPAPWCREARALALARVFAALPRAAWQ